MEAHYHDEPYREKPIGESPSEKPSFFAKFRWVFPILILLLLAYLYSLNQVDLVGNGVTRTGVIHLTGVILESEPVLDQIHQLIHGQGIQALIVRIDSPGGAVGASQEIYEKLRALRETMPVYASMLNSAASGGYYVALGANKIYANKGTITGSIGVVFLGYNVAELMETVGIREVVYKSGKHKDIMSSFREPTEEERKILGDLLENVHGQFKDAVLENRAEIKSADLDSLADGRIFSGAQAYENKLIDGLMSFEQILEVMKEDLAVDEIELVYPEIDTASYLMTLLETNLQSLGFKINPLTGPVLMYLWK